ncbi:uncharacterized protein TA15815 [Theileria annulata]|uniref:Uncharacterized protein n=1 Tax=Theileria annulata TaxID=5874 RepID=Q4UFP6_THEAN|nr:uncharacterized protein TA15815 [Theileria annulata]CAI74070.1 hypothetical protein TA15815 [Theileria annulata]|eukprot:XP_951802.1 hypothetical protein TA15815 [Theileria annulata]
MLKNVCKHAFELNFRIYFLVNQLNICRKMTTYKISHCSNTPKCSTTIIVHKGNKGPVYQELQRVKVIKEKECSGCQCQNSTQEYLVYEWPNSTNYIII